MSLSRKYAAIVAALFALVALSGPFRSEAGLGDKLKKKAEDTAGKAADDAINKTGQKTPTSEAPKSADAETGSSGEAPKGTPEKVSAVSTKFDFLPGDKVLLYDDFTRDELGEFPSRFKLSAGTLEIAEMNGERWCRLASDYGRIRPKVQGLVGMPEFWTLEFDIHSDEPMRSTFEVHGIGEGNVASWMSTIGASGNTVNFQSGSLTAQTEFTGAPTLGGRHHVMVMARGTALKIYVDTQRLVNVPEVASKYSEVELRMNSPEGNPMFTNVRFAEGPKPPKDLLAEGTLVTYGIYFDSGSDVVKPESAPVLRQIASYLETNAAVNVKIVGHTDNQGTPAGNLDLSKRRAASVAQVLAEQFKLAPTRFQTDGLGDTRSIAANDQAEGRAMNRRVEFTKL